MRFRTAVAAKRRAGGVALVCAAFAWGHFGERLTPAAAASPCVPAQLAGICRCGEELAGPRQPLPRTLGGVALGTARSDLEFRWGGLACHPGARELDVCRLSRGGDPEIYLFRDRVVSLAQQLPVPTEPLKLLDSFVRRHGVPTLKGHTERDRMGRLHEIFGWKDAETLEALRFVWAPEPPEGGGRRLQSVILTVWDRAAYTRWEREQTPPCPAPSPAGPAI